MKASVIGAVLLVGSASAGNFFFPQQNPVDCAYSQWTPWTQCSEGCGKQGTRQRTRQVIAQPSNGGAQCDPSLLEEWAPCLEPCAVDCVMGAWSPWSPCQTGNGQSCGLGQQQRTRSILVQPSNGGKQCESLEDWRQCNAGPCPRNCQMGQWAPWTQCPQCGQAQRSRQRQVLVSAAFGGLPCDPNQLETEACQIPSCAVDCQMSQWSLWSQCQTNNGQSCGAGQRQRTRSILVQPQFGGKQCESLEDWESCNAGPCPRDCVMGQWGQWSQCPRCGFAQRQRSRSVLTDAAFGGRPCIEQPLESEPCQLPACEVDCVMAEWGQWGQCTSSNGKQCGQGQRSRFRSVQTFPTANGKQCPTNEEWAGCQLGPCPIDCQMSQWTPFGPCSAECGQGTRTRSRFVLVQPQFGGSPCLNTQDTQVCQDKPCFQPPDCTGRPTEFYVNPAEPCSPLFWKCVNQQTHAHRCPDGLVFDKNSFKCENPQFVTDCRRPF